MGEILSGVYCCWSLLSVSVRLSVDRGRTNRMPNLRSSGASDIPPFPLKWVFRIEVTIGVDVGVMRYWTGVLVFGLLCCVRC